MSTSGAKGTGKKGLGKKGKKQTNSQRAGLVFPVGRIHSRLKKVGRARITTSAAVYLAAVLEYLSAEVLEVAGNAARNRNRSTIKPRDISTAIKMDEDLAKLYAGVVFAEGGVLPMIHDALLPKVTPAQKAAKMKRSEEADERKRNPALKAAYDKLQKAKKAKRLAALAAAS
jgi:histone H2A